MANFHFLFFFALSASIIAQWSVSAAPLRSELETFETLSSEIVLPHAHRQGNHHRYSHEFKQLLNLAKSKGFTVLLLRKRGRGKRNSEFKFTALQLETLRKVWGNEIVKQIRKSTSLEQAYNRCYLHKLSATKNPDEAARFCKELKPPKQNVRNK